MTGDVIDVVEFAAYEKGYKAGRQTEGKELLEELEEILTEKLEAFNKLQKDPSLASPLKHDPEYWTGRAVTCGEILRMVTNLKIRYKEK